MWLGGGSWSGGGGSTRPLVLPIGQSLGSCDWTPAAARDGESATLSFSLYNGLERLLITDCF